MVPMCVRNSEVGALHEQTLTRLRAEAASARRRPGLAATLSHRTLATPEASPRRVGEGLGVRVLFASRSMAPMRMQKQMEALSIEESVHIAKVHSVRPRRAKNRACYSRPIVQIPARRLDSLSLPRHGESSW